MMDFSQFQKTATLKDGSVVTIRAIQPEDKSMLSDAFYELDKESRYTRFFGFKEQVSDEELKRATEVDFDNQIALVVTTTADGKEIIIAGGRYFLLTDQSAGPLRAEIAFTVEEDYQGQGLAGRLFEQLVDIARSKGVSTFEAEVLPQNKAMLAVFAGRGLPMKKTMADGLIYVTLSLI
ncbi:MAG: hypothetical protein BA865_04550 [Desulfobacterales bacterium S5133MH4]|nr:MAG: hypothetical protein BA865_04550 [Desulfobacterales bacterium S5133MH4]